jgi:hypothetical protein
MSRTIPAALLTALGQPNVAPFYAVEFDFDTAPVRFWTGYGDRTIKGNTYIGAGSLIGIGGLEEVADLSAKSATITLSGVPVELVSLALQEPYQNRACRILFGVTDVADVIEVFGGFMDVMTIEDSGETSTISLTVESKLVQLERAKELRYTNESQRALFPNDTFFSFVADLQDKEVVWGRSAQAPAVASSRKTYVPDDNTRGL